MIAITQADHSGAHGRLSLKAPENARVRVFVTGDEGAFDVWARVGTITWDAKWPATLPPEQKFTVRAEVWSRIAHDTVTI